MSLHPPEAKVKPVGVPDFVAAKGRTKLAVVTAYDFTTARLRRRGRASTPSSSATRSAWSSRGTPRPLPVTLDEMVYHTALRRPRREAGAGRRRPAVPDVPGQPAAGGARAPAELLKDGGAHAVKLEGGERMRRRDRGVRRRPTSR